MKQKQFEKLSDQKQWNWIIENKEKIEALELDDDTTWVVLKEFPDPLEMNEYVSGPGAEFLFKAIGIDSRGA